MNDPARRILRVGAGAPNGTPDQNQPTLVTCNGCGQQIMVPMGLAQIASQQHAERCIRPILERILAQLTPDGP